MANLRSHGKEIGTVYFLTHAKRYMSDGHILRNDGFGWKLHAKAGSKVKAELATLSPRELYQRQVAHERDWAERNPAAAAYKKELHGICGLSKRWKLHSAVQMMPDDPDGVWSEACDGYGDNVSADLDDIVKLCALFRLVER